ncbi:MULTISPECIES: hypothetical protein [unclassified Erwinia]|uniref:hypothetical protein n=1 Tax=unclassified Erwinia TaxID=2622719 RepID=UPI00117796BF|nr:MULTISPECIES: hypothetical protein [unclassified Erwinia]
MSAIITDSTVYFNKASGLTFTLESTDLMLRNQGVIEDQNYLVSLYISCIPSNVIFEYMPAQITLSFSTQQTGDETHLYPVPYVNPSLRSFQATVRPFITNVKQNGLYGFLTDTENQIKNMFENGGELTLRIMAVLQPV